MNLFSRHPAPRVTLALLATCLTGSIFSRSVEAQVVQLPAVHTFGTTGTVSVPDRGGALLGGNGYSRSGSTRSGWGPVASRASGSQTGASTMSVHATIIDLDAMDQAILNSAAGLSSASNATTASPSAAAGSQEPASGRSIQTNFRSNRYGTAIANTLNPTRYSQHSSSRSSRVANDWQLAMAGASHIAADDPTPGVAHDQNGEIRHYMQRAADAQNAGRTAAANVYYRLAYDLMSPQQQDRFNTLVEQRKTAALNANKKQVAGDKSASAAATPAATATPTAASEPTAETTASPFDMPPATTDASASPF